LPSFSRSLEQALHRALALAGERRHEYATLEHLLLALLDDQDAGAVMRACNVDVDILRRNLVEYVDGELANLVSDGRQDSKGSSVSSSAPSSTSNPPGARRSQARTCLWQSSPSARATPRISCRSRT
jgi:ATP-dependent Clp protease ATP-binding subunit ClpA